MKVKIILDSEEEDILYNAIANPYIRANKHPCENCYTRRIKPGDCECTVRTFYEKYLGEVKRAGLSDVLEDFRRIRSLKDAELEAKRATEKFSKELREKYVGADSIFSL